MESIKPFIADDGYYHYSYVLTNSINGKIYIGIRQTKDIEKETYMGSGTAIGFAKKKYGEDNFLKQIIMYFSSRDEAKDYEKEVVTPEFIKFKHNYNLREGGGNGKMHPDTVEKIRQQLIGKKQSEETKQKRREWMLENNPYRGKKHSKEVLEKISKTHKGRRLSEEHRKNISLGNTGKKMSREAVEKAAEKKRGIPRPQYVKDKLSTAIDLVDDNGNILKTYKSAVIAAEELGVWKQNISHVLKGKYKSTGGYKFRYHEI